MARFQTKKQSNFSKKLLLTAALFVLLLFLFLEGASSLSEGTRARQRESLENALNRSITYCYAVEGRYPESLDYIKEHYGLTYDESVFFVDYRAAGGNILPDVTIIEKGGR